jgi:hypothetical protein
MLTADLVWTDKAQRCRYLMIMGYPEGAQKIAIELATEALEWMGRRTCPITGHHYFENWESYE